MSRKLIISSLCVLGVSAISPAASNIASTRKFTWAENYGWINWRDAVATAQGGEKFTSSHLRGCIWAENVGWINVGNGAAPYANTNSTNFGVNISAGTGAMSGYAWSENLGWINFGPHAGNARWDSLAHRARGYVWSENAGWINLDDSVRLICSIPGDSSGDGVVNVADFNIMAASFGTAGNPRFRSGDCNGDGTVNVIDFNLLAGNFGAACPSSVESLGKWPRGWRFRRWPAS